MNKRLPAATPAVDRRVQRTRDALRDALFTLMLERGWDTIDVQTLCEQANIGRSTFYQHYANKEELLKASFAGLRDALMSRPVANTSMPGQLAFVPGLIAHVYEVQHMFRALLGRRSGHYVQDRFRELLIEMVLASAPPGKSRSWQSQAQAHYLAGALFELLAWWLGNNRPQKPSEIEALFYQWSQPVLTPSGH
nr:TetR/AcrR family transcriptional regulator [uncultured Rhodoferax sp.]